MVVSEPTLTAPCPSCTGGPSVECRTVGKISWEWNWGDSHLSSPAGHAAFDQNINGFWDCKHALSARVRSFHPLKSFFTRLLSIRSSPNPYRCLGLPQAMSRVLYLALLNLMGFALAQCSSLSRSCWPASCPSSMSSLVSSTNLLCTLSPTTHVIKA